MALCNELRSICCKALPTATHEFIASLKRLGKLRRVYTQNIDDLEAKAGLRTSLEQQDSQTEGAAEGSYGGNVDCVQLHGSLAYAFLDIESRIQPRQRVQRAVKLCRHALHAKRSALSERKPDSDVEKQGTCSQTFAFTAGMIRVRIVLVK